MTLGLIVTIALWASAVFCAAVAVSGYVLAVRSDGGWREPASWCGPLTFTSATVALLTAAGVLGLIPGAALALLPLLALAAMVTPAWRDVAGQKGAVTATGVILGRVAGRVRDGLWNAREDLRDIGARLRPGEDFGEAPAPAAARPAAAAAPLRQVPSIRSDPSLGTAPTPAEVGAGLQASGAAVPPAWAALADYIRTAEFDTEEEHLEHMAGEAAGVLTVAEAFQARAENLSSEVGLDPAYIGAHFELADEFADFASVVAMVDRRYQVVYDLVRQYVDNGGIMPHNARKWFNDAGAADGAAA